MNRSETLEYFLLGYDQEIQTNGRGRPTTIGQLWQDAKKKYEKCEMEDLLYALYNLQPNHAELTKHINTGAGTQLVSFKREPSTERWEDFFTVGSFRVKTLPAGRIRFDELSEQLELEQAQHPTSHRGIDYSSLADWQLDELAVNYRIRPKRIVDSAGERYVRDRQHIIEELMKRDAAENSSLSQLVTSASSVGNDRRFARMAIDEARKSVPELDARPHPKVGAVVVKNGQVLSVAHRGEAAGNHAEFIALEKKLSDEAVAGATVYTTLEPCTTRNPPKIPCADRLVERRVTRVVIGMLDPDVRIRGLGLQKLRSAGIRVSLFDPDMMDEVEELNREFIRFCKQQTHPPHVAVTESRPEIIVTCDWPSGPVSGSSLNALLKRTLVLKNVSDKVALNVQILDIVLPKGKAQFNAIPVIEKSERKPMVCQVKRSEGFEFLNAWDLESLIAVQGEGISLADPIIRIPIVVRYEETNKSVWESVNEMEYDLFNGKGEIKFKDIRKIS